jgi:hypothetical protein
MMSPVLQGSALWRAPDPADTKFRANGGAELRRFFRCKPHPVRAQGIGGARSGRVNYKIHAQHGFYSWRDGTPAKPGFLHSKKCAQITHSVSAILCSLYHFFELC